MSLLGDIEEAHDVSGIDAAARHGKLFSCRRMACRPANTQPGARNKPQPTDRLFPTYQHELFNRVLEEEGLKFDREGQRRTFYSLRHTYICLRLMEGADIYQIAKNCRTSVEMIEKYYASHIKNRLDAAAINVRRPRPPKKEVEAVRAGELA